MRVTVVVPLLGLSILLVCCAGSYSTPQPATSQWTTGFWYWNPWGVHAAWSHEPIDTLYVQAGTIGQRTWRDRAWDVSGNLPSEIPAARELWVVFRFETRSAPDPRYAEGLTQELTLLRDAARRRQLELKGIQLDIDCPTAQLGRYAAFLRELRKTLPAKLEISITALLDWFRSGTAIADVIRETDEFVPQFYDLGDLGERFREGPAIAARIDAERWGRAFNRFRKRYRVGISTFGRMIAETKGRSYWYRDMAPIEIATNPSFGLEATKNEAGETILTYRALRKVRISYNDFAVGDKIQFILPTSETVRDGVASARRMGGYAAGVVFFRWPHADESLVMQPSEVFRAAGVSPNGQRGDRVYAIKGGCANVECVDLYLESSKPLASQALRYRVRSSIPFEYFLPEQPVPVRMSAPTELSVSLPPFCARGRLYLGRGVTLSPAQFTVEEVGQ